MRNKIVLAASMAGLLALGCDLDMTVPDFNNPSLEELENEPTPAGIAAAATGLLVSGRDEFEDGNGYISLLGILGRESYNFDGADPRFVTEMLESQLNPSSPAFGGNLWAERYRNLRAGTIILNALDKVTGMTPAGAEAVRGFVKTMQAHELLLVINTRDGNGAVVDIHRDAQEDPAPLVGRDQTLSKVATLLDEGAAHLAAGGQSFPFPLTSGFSGFDTPATFLEFNRGLKARVEVYRGNYNEALQALDRSFLTLDPDRLDLGVYHAFSTGSGDDANDLFDPGSSPDILAHPSIVEDAELRAGGDRDLRVQRKIRQLPASRTVRGITTDVAFSIYNSLSAPVPILRNEELILLRAEANIGLGDPARQEAALEDLNFIRVHSGGLEPLTSPADATLDELLRQKRYSLLFEGGHRWIDLRRYGRLSELPLDRTNHVRNEAFPIPEAECLARGQQTCRAGS